MSRRVWRAVGEGFMSSDGFWIHEDGDTIWWGWDDLFEEDIVRPCLSAEEARLCVETYADSLARWIEALWPGMITVREIWRRVPVPSPPSDLHWRRDGRSVVLYPETARGICWLSTYAHTHDGEWEAQTLRLSPLLGARLIRDATREGLECSQVFLTSHPEDWDLS